MSEQPQHPDHVILRDATGQPWAISVRPDGQLQTAKWPDGEPLVAAREIPVDLIRDVVADTFESILKPETVESLQQELEFHRSLLANNPRASERYKRVIESVIAQTESEIARLRLKGEKAAVN